MVVCVGLMIGLNVDGVLGSLVSMVVLFVFSVLSGLLKYMCVVVVKLYVCLFR